VGVNRRYTVAARIQPGDVGAPRGQIAHDVPGVFLGHDHFDLHVRLQQDRLGFHERIFHRHRAGDLERQVRRVDLVIRPFENGHFDAHRRVPGHDSALGGLADSILHRLDVLFRDRAANHLVLDDEILFSVLVQRFDLDHGMAVLAAAARLADEATFALRFTGDRFPVRDARPAYTRVHLELAQHAIDQHFQVQLAHARHQRLAGLVVDADHERRIFLGQFGQRLAHLVLVGFGLRLDRDEDHRRGELDRFQDDWVLSVGQRFAGEGVLQAEGRRNVACVNLGDVFASVGEHAHHAANPLALVFGRVHHRRTGVDHARIDAEESQPPDERIGDDLEDQGRQRLVIRRVALFYPVVLRVDALNSGHIQRRGQIGHHGIQHQLDALIPEG